MRRATALVLASFLLACGGGESYETAEAGGMEAATIDLASVAGTWNLTGTLGTGDEPTVVNYSVMATDSETGWMLHLPDREPIEIMIVAIDGDSIVGQTPEFESIIRDGVMVSTRTVLRLTDGMLTGTLTATYDTDPVETVPGTFEGTRAEP